MNLFTYKIGKSTNQPIIFVHGFPYDHTMWKKQIDHFQNDYHCTTYDIRGLGRNIPEDFSFTIDDLAEDLIQITRDCLEETNQKPVICGLSMGGYIALRAFEKEGELFKSLILCNTRTESDSNEGKVKRAFLVNKINQFGLSEFLPEFIANCFSIHSFQGSAELLQFGKILAHSHSFHPSGVKANLIAMAARTDTTHVLEKIQIPTLVISGQYDMLTPVDVMKNFASKIKTSRFVTITNAAHLTPIENSTMFNQELTKFLASLS